MLDHAFVQAVAAMRSALADALLQRTQTDEHFGLDLVTGDVTWETTFTLPGEDEVPRVQATITFEWSTWSQTAYRASILEPGDDAGDNEPPDITVEILFRVQRLAHAPDVDAIGKALPDEGPELERRPPAVEQQFDEPGHPTTFAVEFPFDGVYEVPDDDVAPLGAWIASSLVRLADLQLAYVEAG
jgi:hypothetical protein